MNNPSDYVVTDTGFTTPCLIFNGRKDENGYGRVGYNEYAHRRFYENRYGPTESLLHHLCETPPCVNPEHLEPISRSEHPKRHSKLTDEQVAEIRASRLPHRRLAHDFGVSKAQIGRILRGESR